MCYEAMESKSNIQIHRKSNASHTYIYTSMWMHIKVETRAGDYFGDSQKNMYLLSPQPIKARPQCKCVCWYIFPSFNNKNKIPEYSHTHIHIKINLLWYIWEMLWTNVVSHPMFPMLPRFGWPFSHYPHKLHILYLVFFLRSQLFFLLFLLFPFQLKPRWP